MKKLTPKEYLQKYAVPESEFLPNPTLRQQQIIDQEIRNYYLRHELRKKRRQLGLTQAVLAKKAELPRTTITKIESGSYNPTLETLHAIAAAMNKKLEIHFA